MISDKQRREVAWLKYGMKLHSTAISMLLDAHVKEEKASGTDNEPNLKENLC